MTTRPPMFSYPVQQPAVSNGLGTTALVLGIVGLVLFWVPGLNLVLGVLAATFGAIGVTKARNHTATNEGSAMAGVVLGIVTLVGSVALFAIAAAIS